MIFTKSQFHGFIQNALNSQNSTSTVEEFITRADHGAPEVDTVENKITAMCTAIGCQIAEIQAMDLR